MKIQSLSVILFALLFTSFLYATTTTSPTTNTQPPATVKPDPSADIDAAFNPNNLSNPDFDNDLNAATRGLNNITNSDTATSSINENSPLNMPNITSPTNQGPPGGTLRNTLNSDGSINQHIER